MGCFWSEEFDKKKLNKLDEKGKVWDFLWVFYGFSERFLWFCVFLWFSRFLWGKDQPRVWEMYNSMRVSFRCYSSTF